MWEAPRGVYHNYNKPHNYNYNYHSCCYIINSGYSANVNYPDKYGYILNVYYIDKYNV